MKNNLVRVSIMVLGAAAAFAQTPSLLKANIPFNFTASSVNLPAGSYLIDTKTPSMVTLHSRENRVNAMVGTGAAESAFPSKDARLVFHRYGNQYFLADIWITGNSYGRHIPMTKQERTLAQHKTEPSEVIVAARQ